jgi:allantoin racemase
MRDPKISIMKIKVVVPVSTNKWNEIIREQYEEYKDPETIIDIINIEKGPESITSVYDDAWAELFTILEAEKAEEEGYDGVIIYCGMDPALEATKQALSIPVVGISEPSLHLAFQLGKKLAVVGPGGLKADINKNYATFGDSGRYGLPAPVSRRYGASIERPVLDIFDKMEEIKKGMLEAAKKAIHEDGADIIYAGCGALIEPVQYLQENLNVPVIANSIVALKTLEMIIKLGLSQSKKAFPKPPKKKRLM